MADNTKSIFSAIAKRLQRNNGYLARLEIERIVQALSADPKRLEPHGFKVYSQNDEDGIIEEICRRLGITTGRFVEIGIENGLECNSLYLIHKGWRGVWIEGDASQRRPIEGKFGSILGSRLKVHFGMVGVDNIDQIIEKYVENDELDLLSIDIDGNDIYILEKIRIQPKIICVEYNAKFPANIVKQQVHDPNRVWNGSDYMGSSLKALTQVAAAKGYQLVGTNIVGANAFFVRQDLAGDLFAADASAENLYNPPRYWLWSDHYISFGHPADFGPYVDLQGP